jgi:protein-S-isoprenylcysteine O-methyltransferase Ste14
MGRTRRGTTVQPPRHPTWRWSNVPLPEAHLTLFGLALLLERRRAWPLAVPGGRRVGSALVLAGAVLAAAATRAAGDVDLAHPGRLVVTGPYRWSRHPMYAAWSLGYVGGALLGNTAWPLGLAPALAVWVGRDVRREERLLAEAFGADHARYRRSVRRVV